MIQNLTVTNFKCFGSMELSFGNLTLLTGLNAGGKSSALQPLLLLSQAAQMSDEPSSFDLNGSLVTLGTVGDVLPTGSGTTAFPVIYVSSDRFRARWSFSARAGDRYFTSEAQGRDQIGILQDLRTLVYLSAVRAGTREAYPIPSRSGGSLTDIGMDGRFAPYWYDKMVDEEVPVKRRHPNELASSYRKQLDAWLGSLFPGAQANVQQLPQISVLSVQFRRTDFGEWHRPANIGYGLTYAFPILVALLSAKEGQTIVIDSPEAHLHPSAQSQMGRVLAHFAAAGIQVVVETHSDHLLNGVRVAVKEKAISNDAVRVHFFGGATEKDSGIISLEVDPQGGIEEWPSGFFDQIERDLAKL